jgi:DNA-directed RNA polymerase subunit N (RpoN/RPB10)
MYFKIEKGTDTFKKLSELKKQIDSITQQAKDVVTELGGERYCHHRYKLAGGISAIEFKKKPDGWKSVGESWQDLHMPLAKNKEACNKVENLPTLDYEVLNKIVGFKGPQTVSSGNGLAFVKTVGLNWCTGKYYLMEVATGCKYKPLSDIVEILESEFLKLKGKDN